MLEWNPKWQEPGWQYSERKPAEYVRDYADRARWVKSVQGIWALAQGAALEIYTLIESDREAERELHKIELDFFRKWEDAPVRFHIYRDRSTLQEQVAGTEPVVIEA